MKGERLSNRRKPGCVLETDPQSPPPYLDFLPPNFFFVLAQNDTKCVKTRLEAKKSENFEKKNFSFMWPKKNLVKFSKKNEKFFFGFFFDFIL